MPISTYMRELRAVVGPRLLLLPGVAAVLRDASERVLFMHRADDGRWGLPARAHTRDALRLSAFALLTHSLRGYMRHVRSRVPVLCISVLATACGQDAAQRSDSTSPAPSAAATAAPDSFSVAFQTTRGNFVVEVIRAWSPRGADRFHELVSSGFFTDVAFFRVLPGFVAQFGMHGDPDVNRRWSDRRIPDDPVVQSNKRGTIVFATSGPNSRGNQFFINFADNTGLDRQGFSPFGRVVEGMAVVDSIYAAYGEAPDQSRIADDGNAYLKREFPRLDYITSARVVGPSPRPIGP